MSCRLVGDAKVTLRSLIDEAKPKSAETSECMDGKSSAVRGRVASGSRPILKLRCGSDAPGAHLQGNIRGVAGRRCGGFRHRPCRDLVGHHDRSHAARAALHTKCGIIGMGIPRVIGREVRTARTPVLCFTGDGGMYYHLAELETAARYGINVVVLVNNNSALNQEIPLINAAYGRTNAAGPMKCGDSEDRFCESSRVAWMRGVSRSKTR